MCIKESCQRPVTWMAGPEDPLRGWELVELRRLSLRRVSLTPGSKVRMGEWKRVGGPAGVEGDSL